MSIQIDKKVRSNLMTMKEICFLVPNFSIAPVPERYLSYGTIEE